MFTKMRLTLKEKWFPYKKTCTGIRDILILGKSLTQGLHNTKLTAEAQYSISFTKQDKKFCSSLHCNGNNSYSFVNRVKIYQSKAKYSELYGYPLCLGSILKDL